MHGKKKKGENKERAFEEIKNLYSNISKDDILMIARYSLDPLDPRKKCRGVLFADRIFIYVIKDGEEYIKVPIDTVESINTEIGVGSGFVSLKMKNGEYCLLCCADMSESKRALRETKRFNRILERGDVATFVLTRRNGEKSSFDGISEAIGHGESRSIRAKLKNVTRLWNILKKHKIFILSAMIMFIFVSVLNLVLPEINRIITDDYINNKTSIDLVLSDYVIIIALMLAVQIFIRLFTVLRMLSPDADDIS